MRNATALGFQHALKRSPPDGEWAKYHTLDEHSAYAHGLLVGWFFRLYVLSAPS